MSAAFERFRYSFFEDVDSARQGLDTASLAELDDEERARAERMLIHHLPDTRGVIGLGVLRSRRAEPALQALFEDERRTKEASRLAADGYWAPYQLIYIAKALWLIRPDPRRLAAVIDILASAGDANERQSAAEALYDVRDPAVAHALVTALDDPEPLVRYHAARGLLAMHGLPADSRDPAPMMYRLMARDLARRDGGKQDVLGAVAGRPLLAP